MKLSEHFTLAEFVRSATASRLQIDNTPSEIHVLRLAWGVAHVLEPLRSVLGEPVQITSGYRCAALNAEVGGVASSYHLLGCAADIHVPTVDYAVRAFRFLETCDYVDTVLFERSKSSQWLHVQWRIMTANRHKSNFNYKV